MVAEHGGKKVSSLPFPAIVGQEDLKRVLLAVGVDDTLDGVLITGEKGTAKSTAVRALTGILPEQPTISDCPYGCAPDTTSLQCGDCRDRDDPPIEHRSPPLVTLPLGATRDRVVGTLSVENAMAGEVEFDPGLLARAHRGILYVDEVNLLEDHLVDVILDVAASGVNTVERDGMSVSHPASFTLIGTMNPEEGDLRPQLRDRFSLQVTVEGARDLDSRVEIIDRALESDPSGCCAADSPSHATQGERYADKVQALRERLAASRERVALVTIPPEQKTRIARLCLEAGVDGHRGDIATARTARALAALDGRSTVDESDVIEAATYTLPHRLQSTPFEEAPNIDDVLEDEFGESSDDANSDSSDASDGDGDDGTGERNDAREADRETESTNDTSPGSRDSAAEGSQSASADTRGGETARRDDTESSVSDGSNDTESPASDASSDESGADTDDASPLIPGQQRAGVGEAAAPSLPEQQVTRDRPARGSGTATAPDVDNHGPRVRTEPASGSGRIDAAASVRSAATHGRSHVDETDLRQSVRSGETGATIVFVVDASASMRPAMRAAKGVVFDLLCNSYQNRDRVAFVAFAGDDAEVLLPPTKSTSLAARHLKTLPTGDRTPLPAGLETARSLLERDDPTAGVVILVTDGKANVADGSPTSATRTAAQRLAKTADQVLVVDTDTEARHGLTEVIVGETDGNRMTLSSLTAERVRSSADQTMTDS